MARKPEEYPHCSLYLRKLKAQGLKPDSKAAMTGTTKVVP